MKISGELSFPKSYKFIRKGICLNPVTENCCLICKCKIYKNKIKCHKGDFKLVDFIF